MFDVDIMITDSCFVLLFPLGNGGCAGVTERRQLHIFLRCVCRRVFRVPYAPSGYISVSVSLVYMHSGWYLAQ